MTTEDLVSGQPCKGAETVRVTRQLKYLADRTHSGFRAVRANRAPSEFNTREGSSGAFGCFPSSAHNLALLPPTLLEPNRQVLVQDSPELVRRQLERCLGL